VSEQGVPAPPAAHGDPYFPWEKWEAQLRHGRLSMRVRLRSVGLPERIAGEVLDRSAAMRGQKGPSRIEQFRRGSEKMIASQPL
jgi:hypothetical protein